MKHILIFTILLTSILSQSPKERFSKSNDIFKSVFSHYQKQEYKEAISGVHKYLQLRENHSTAQYYLSLLYANIKDENNTVYYLKKLIDKNYILDITKKNEFEFLNKQIKKELIEGFKKNSNKRSNAKEIFHMHEKGLIAESVAFNPNTGNYYVSSVREKTIFKRDKKGKFSVFKTFKSGVFSLKFSKNYNYLWATISNVPQQRISSSENENGLIKIHTRTGKIEAKYLLNDKKSHNLGDFIISKSNDIYITDSKTSEIFVVKQNNDKIETFLSAGYFSSLQGLVQKGNSLIIVDYSEGLFSIDLESKEITRLSSPKNLDLRGIDGLYGYKNTLIATQNGFKPNRVIQLFLNEHNISSYKTLEANTKFLNDPTLGTIVKDHFIFISNSGWNELDRNLALKPKKFLKPNYIMNVRLK